MLLMRFRPFLLLLILSLSACGGSQHASSSPASADGEEVQNDAQKAHNGAIAALDEATLDALLGETPRAPIPLNRKRARLGEADAEITILFFSDLECPYCAIAMRTIRELMERNPGKIRLYQIHYPLPSHVHADGAARIAEALRVEQGDEAFYAFIDRLNPDERRLNEPLIRALALELGLSEETLDGALDDYDYDAEVRGDVALGRVLGIRGTPASLMNGRLIPGARPLEDFEEALREELEITKELRALGVARGDEYRALVAHFFGEDGLAAMEGND